MQVSNNPAVSALAYQQNQPAKTTTTPQTTSTNTLQNDTVTLSQAAKDLGGAEILQSTATETKFSGGDVEPRRGGGSIVFPDKK
ncbi:hypothetical protein KO527_11140 [Pseudoalteromonas sp. C2R02]|uniref:hypothetical protein n=1 Tax=Pseudoalteromonas sp. C2R02 TaxID=2841565 RepID=UPI001C0A2C0A|nr:hypothetical protein [Pseudoalteromonas sp. C2R02]MBU2969903.1 hypothetical protein [Pseudoalteromonas sp. C2R02]